MLIDKEAASAVNEKENTPLLPQASNKKQVASSQIIAAIYNTLTTVTYFVSANGFFKHLSESTDSPEAIREKIHNLDHNVTDLTAPWQYIVLIGFVFGSAVLLVSNQRSMPINIQQLFDWHTTHNKKPDGPYKKHYVFIESALSALWKTLVSSTSLAALGAPYIGFWPSVILAASALLGNVFAQMTNFINKESVDLAIPSWLKKGIAGYSTISFCVSSGAIYVNTTDQAFQRIGWMDKRLLQIESLPVSIIVNGIHALLALNFVVQSYKHYYPRLANLMGLRQGPPDLLPINNFNITVSAGPSNLPQPTAKQNNYSFWRKVDKGGIGAAGYKTIGVFLGLLSMMALATRLDNFSWSTFLIFGVALFLQVPNFISQTTFYTKTSGPIEQEKNKVISKLLQCFNYLAHGCKEKEGASNEEDIHIKQTLLTSTTPSAVYN